MVQNQIMTAAASGLEQAETFRPPPAIASLAQSRLASRVGAGCHRACADGHACCSCSGRRRCGVLGASAIYSPGRRDRHNSNIPCLHATIQIPCLQPLHGGCACGFADFAPVGKVCVQSGVYLRQEHACLSDRITLAGRLDPQADLTARQT